MYIEGKSSPNVTIVLELKKDNEIVKTWEVNSNEQGEWNFSTDDLFKEGVYKISAKAKDNREAISNSSPEKEIKILLSGVAFGPLLVTFWQLASLLILVIIVFVSIILVVLYRTKKENKRIDKEIREAEESLEEAFNFIKNNLEKRIESFDYREGLSPREKKIRDEMFDLLEESKKIVEKDIKDIKNKKDS